MNDLDAYPKPAHGWTCFHCGETFTSTGSARYHFGFDPSSDPACRIKIGAERGLLMELRKAEAHSAEAWKIIADEFPVEARVYREQNARHQAQLMAAEELGYERGIADARAELANPAEPT